MLKKESHCADADEELDPMEASDYMKCSRPIVVGPAVCFGLSCPHRSTTCDFCGLVEKKFLDDGFEEVVPKFPYERRKWYESEPPIKSPNEAKLYVFLAAPALRGKRRLEFA